MIVSSSSNSGKRDSAIEVVEMARDLQTYVERAARSGTALREVEGEIFSRVLRIGFEMASEFIRRQGNGDLGPELTTESGQVIHRSPEPVERLLRTIFGEHSFEQFVYSPGSHEKIALRPIDAGMQLSEGRTSYLFDEFSQYFCVDQAFAQAAHGVEMVLRQKVSVDTLERINRRMGDQAAEFLDQLPTPPRKDEGELLVCTADGKGVPMVNEERTSGAAFQERPERPGNRRMAILAGVYSVDRYVRSAEDVVAALFRDGERPHSGDRPEPKFKHLRACFEKLYDADTDAPTLISGPIEAFSWANAEVERRLRRQQPLIRLMDGQINLWDVADTCLEAAPADRTVDILDVLHVSQYVWQAAKAFYSAFEHQEAFARNRLLRILQGGVQQVITGMRQMATQRKLSGQQRRAVNTVCGYFKKNAHRMRYDEYLREGYPIATGVIEGACRHLVKDRMERSGMRWRMQGAQAMLNVRAVWQSSYWKEFHVQRMKCEQATTHRHRALIDKYNPVTLNA